MTSLLNDSMFVCCVKVFSLCSFIGLAIGCSLIEPSAKQHFDTKPNTSVNNVFSCAKKTLHLLKSERATWSDTITMQNIQLGILETDNYNQVNRVGIRVQIQYQIQTGQGSVRVKASGPYFVNLGAEEAALLLTKKIRQCLSE